MKDLTIIFLTFNRVAPKWAEYHKEKLIEAIGDTSVITISREPLNWGTNLLQTEYSVRNVYTQILRGAKLAVTPYIAIAEDDTLYPKEHFQFRPPMDKFAYNVNRWGLFTWGRGTYFSKPRIATGLMIAPRGLVISSLEKKLEFSSGEISGRNARELGYRTANTIEFTTEYPVVCVSHPRSLDPLSQRARKKLGPVQRFDLPPWGNAKQLVSRFCEGYDQVV